ncbi:MAG: hypothetical protein WDO74_31315 [Pseudomonadota bacterium]
MPAESLGSARAVVTYPVRVTGTEAYLEVREGLLKDGYRRAWLGGKTCELDAIKPSQVLESGALEVIVDRVGSGKDEKRLAQGIETAWARAAGVAHIHSDSARFQLRRGLACPECSRELAAPRDPGCSPTSRRSARARPAEGSGARSASTSPSDSR